MTSYAKARQLIDEFGKAFGVEAKQRGFKKLALRRWIRQEPKYSISFGLQKSQWSPFLYVNCGLTYEDLGASAKLSLPLCADVYVRAQVFMAPGTQRALSAASDFTNKVSFEARLALIPKIFDAVISLRRVIQRRRSICPASAWERSIGACMNSMRSGAVVPNDAQETVCAKVKIEIKQELTLERQAVTAEVFYFSLLSIAAR